MSIKTYFVFALITYLPLLIYPQNTTTPKDKSTQIAVTELLYAIPKLKENKNFYQLELTLQKIGQHYQKQENYVKALQYFLEALHYKKICKNQAAHCQLYFQIAFVFNRLNKNQLAKSYLKKARDEAIRFKNPDMKMMIRQLYSKIYFEMHEFSLALSYINACIKSISGLKNSTHLVELYYQQSSILKEMGNMEQSRKYLEMAIQKSIDTKTYDLLLPLISEHIEYLFSMKKITKIDNLLDIVDDIYAYYYDHYYFYYYAKALQFELSDNLIQAEKYYSKSISELEKYLINLPDPRLYEHKFHAEKMIEHIILFFFQQFKKTDKYNYLEKAIYLNEIKDLSNFKYYYQETENAPLSTLEEQRIKEELLFFENCLQQSEKKLSAKNLNYYQEKFLSLKKQRAEWKELMAETPVSISHYLESDFNLKRISTAFSPNQLLIRYCLLENDIIAFYLTDQTIDALLLSEHPKVLQKKIQHLSEPLLDFSCGQVDYLQINFDLYTAQELYQILLEPILEKFPEKKELFIVADKELKIIPFDALVMSFKDTDMFSDEIIFSEYGQANYVADQYLIQYMLTLFHADQRNTPFKKKYFSIAAFGLPLINQSDLILQSLLAENPCLNPKPLPATRTEIDKIRAVYGNQPMYSALESDFTKENFFAYAPQANIVHIATHFIFNKSFPLQSAFIFSPGNDQQMFFYMKDFLKMKAALECLVLSACETSRGLLQDDQRLSSIASTWHFSGIKRVIASFWPIDEFTAELMPLFYEKLKQTNNYSIALNQAKLIFKNKVITIDKSHKISFAHPFLWANYGLFKLY